MDYQIQEVFGKTLGIVGYGAIGKRVAQVAEAFGMHVLVAKSLTGVSENKHDRVDLEDLCMRSDVISIHCPLSDVSNNLFNAALLKLMKPESVLINMGRGGIVNEQDLMLALKSGELGAAATDVLTQEPPSRDHVLLDEHGLIQ